MIYFLKGPYCIGDHLACYDHYKIIICKICRLLEESLKFYSLDISIWLLDCFRDLLLNSFYYNNSILNILAYKNYNIKKKN